MAWLWDAAAKTRRAQWSGRRQAWTILGLGLVVVGLLGWVFGETASAVISQDDIAAIDSPVTRWLVERRQPWATAAFNVVTELGSVWFVVLLIVVVMAVLLQRGRSWGDVLVVPLSSGGAALIVTFVKLAVARPRPELGEIVATASGFAFPSGHSAQAVACYGALAWVIAHVTMTRRSTVLAWTGAAVVAFLIGFSRLYLGVHWLSDVLGGWVLGAAWLTVVLSAVVAGHFWSDVPRRSR